MPEPLKKNTGMKLVIYTVRRNSVLFMPDSKIKTVPVDIVGN
jgi:hypothetical protein